MPTDDNHFRRLRLNLATEIEPIQGQLIDDRGKVWPFMGWLDLVQVLEAALEPRPNAIPGSTEPPREDR